jgi:signal transduction histidine kinase
MIVPLRVRERVLGAISLAAAESGRRYGPDDLALAEQLAERAALAIDNARLYREARAAVRIREEFLAVASHELRTPLTNVKGYVQLLDRQLRGDDGSWERLRGLIDPLQTQVRRLETLVGDLLDVSRLQRGRLELRPEAVELGELARQVVARFDHSPHRTPRHSLIVDAPSPVAGVWDAARLDQVLTNLVGNALKFSPTGGEVRVAVRREADEALLTVSDEGLGIGPEERAALFEPFRRGEATARAIPGVGLGLYIAAEIVARHGGRIEVASAVGEGSTFVVRLPLAGRT